MRNPEVLAIASSARLVAVSESDRYLELVTSARKRLADHAIQLLDREIRRRYPDGIESEQADCVREFVETGDPSEVAGMLDDMEARMCIHVEGVRQFLGIIRR